MLFCLHIRFDHLLVCILSVAMLFQYQLKQNDRSIDTKNICHFSPPIEKFKSYPRCGLNYICIISVRCRESQSVNQQPQTLICNASYSLNKWIDLIRSGLFTLLQTLRSPFQKFIKHIPTLNFIRDGLNSIQIDI